MVEAVTKPSDAAARLQALGYDPEHLLKQYRDQGYIIIEGILSSDPASPLHLDSLRKCAETAIQLTRDGRWPHRRVVGNPFPPFTKDCQDSWGVQHIMNPELDTLANSSVSLTETFQQFYGNAALLDVASLLIGAQREEMQMELFNLLINPSSHRFALGWHRDDIRPDVSADEEQARLDTPTYGVQFNTALYDDDCLFIVPGTQRRLRTPAEIQANNAKAPPATLVGKDGDQEKEQQSFAHDGAWQGVDPPNTLRVKLKPGQTAFYSQRILHRASYLPSAKRATLHGCFGDASESDKAAAERARNILQHGVEWMRDPKFSEALPKSLKPSKFRPLRSVAGCRDLFANLPLLFLVANKVWANLIRMDAACADKDLGYSLDND